MLFLQDIKDKLRPDTLKTEKIDAFITKINACLKKKGLCAECVKGGSVAKGTFLKDDFDVDLFVKFDHRYKDEDLAELLADILRPFAFERLHGSRDYFQIIRQSILYEIVPVLDITDPAMAKNVTDMSPFHVDWVKKRLQDGQRDEIRLTKQFCKAQRVYGAESYIRGFSGHVLDILVIRYGTFISLLKAAKDWKPKVVIDVEGYYKGHDALTKINPSKTTGPLIVIDPILKERNAAASLSLEKFNVFRKKAREFLISPSPSFFTKEKYTCSFLQQKAGNYPLLVLKIEPKPGKEDVVGAKLLQAYNHIKKSFLIHGFVLKEADWDWQKGNEAIFWYLFKTAKIPKETAIPGPPLKLKRHVQQFKKSHHTTFEKGSRIYAREAQEYSSPVLLLDDLMQKRYLQQKIQTFKYLMHPDSP